MEFDSFVLAASTADLDDEAAARDDADAVEFRMDLADDPLAALDDYDGTLPLLATNRATWEGGEADDEGRLAVLAEAVDHDAVEAVDVEAACFEGRGGVDAAEADALREHARESGVAVVASVHDFEGTARPDALREQLSAACDAGDVGKLATTATDRGDALALLQATYAVAADGGTPATMAMGEPGRHTRAVAPVYGSRIGYAPVDPADATAPGQYDLGTLRTLVDLLGGD
ncbi:type I 3-dehydroquinate dehydratase [Halobium salinum]|uniref:3-dehydroquinate dehydratase n=1 Tax=Halobium salinum TaxID=1364940 RepID=A0ABD5PGW4_9EURY|nr:type I 3-dehydroquinate dehydratase [Halobium salinum]